MLDRASVGYLFIMLWVSYFKLHEKRPCLWFTIAFLLWALAQIVLLLASQPICEVSNDLCRKMQADSHSLVSAIIDLQRQSDERVPEHLVGNCLNRNAVFCLDGETTLPFEAQITTAHAFLTDHHLSLIHI